METLSICAMDHFFCFEDDNRCVDSSRKQLRHAGVAEPPQSDLRYKIDGIQAIDALIFDQLKSCSISPSMGSDLKPPPSNLCNARSGFAAGLQFYVVTWNMNGRIPLGNLVKLLEDAGTGYDFYIVGLQEAPNCSLETSILDVLGQNYCLVAASIMLSLQLFIFVRKPLESLISDIKIDKVGVGGFGGVVGRQKGAVAVALRFKKTSFLFIACHLAPHESNVEERNAQLLRICQGVFARAASVSICSCLPNSSAVADEHDYWRNTADYNVVEESDVVIWLGDLNYRVEGHRSSVFNMIRNNLEKLTQKDQLSRAVERGEIFKGFQEGPLSFKPTYKFDVGTDNYDTSGKERIPSWTDRVLFKVKNGSRITANVHQYDSIEGLKTSDHRPVKALLKINNIH